MWSGDDLDRADECPLRERREQQPAAVLDVMRVRLVHAAGLLLGEGSHVPDRRASLDAVDEDGCEPVELAAHLARVETADLDLPGRQPVSHLR